MSNYWKTLVFKGYIWGEHVISESLILYYGIIYNYFRFFNRKIYEAVKYTTKNDKKENIILDEKY